MSIVVVRGTVLTARVIPTQGSRGGRQPAPCARCGGVFLLRQTEDLPCDCYKRARRSQGDVDGGSIGNTYEVEL